MGIYIENPLDSESVFVVTSNLKAEWYSHLGGEGYDYTVDPLDEEGINDAPFSFENTENPLDTTPWSHWDED
ncbi:MAG: hypothetical protein N3G78_07555 [Desulfobacterota bacterium]|nr:hypothetical protein [Thermodesulfobacteriota bacterium]